VDDVKSRIDLGLFGPSYRAMGPNLKT